MPEQSTGDERPPLAMASHILDVLLAVPSPGRDEIALQVAVARCRQIDADGSLRLSRPATALAGDKVFGRPDQTARSTNLAAAA
jgi:hypothetical protein